MIEPADRARLLDAARQSIRERMTGAPAGEPDLAGVPPRLLEPGASFVTLTVDGCLQGCIGSIVATRALLSDVWHNAQGAAFGDPRFAPLTAAAMPGAGVEVAVLGPLEPVPAGSQAELLAALRPGVDGLLLRFGAQRATFLPKVWDSLPDPAEFLRHLKRKLGESDDFWDAAVVAERYRTETFAGPLIP